MVNHGHMIAETVPASPLARRALLVLLASTTASFAVPALGNEARKRIVSLDWGLTETAEALGANIIGAAALADYEIIVGSPALPLLDLGSWNAPNLELLQRIKPEIALIQQWQKPLADMLQTICPVDMTTIYTRSGSPYDNARDGVQRLGVAIGLENQATTFLHGTDETMARLRTQLKSYDGRPVVVLKLIDDANLIAFSESSLFDGVLRQLGLTNGWRSPLDLLCGATRINVAALADQIDARFVIIASPAGGESDAFYQGQVWSRLPAVKAGRVVCLPSFWEFGGLPTARRFAIALSNALVRDASGHG
jgi:iron complex transport system substrate-binding protein